MDENKVLQDGLNQTATEKIQQAETTTQSEGTQQATEQTVPADDLVTRVSQLKEETKPVENFEGFDYKDIEKISDPQAKEFALNAYKSLQKGFNKKFEDVAHLRKAYENKEHDNANWTPERIQQVMQNQSFVSAAQSVMATQQALGGNLTNDEYSALTDTEKQQFHDMRSQLNMITQQNSKLIQQQQDERLQSRYANYSPATIDSMTTQLLNGQYQATREDIHKVIDYEAAVKRAYALGKQDRQLDLSQKQAGTTTAEGVQMTQASDVPVKEKGESNFNYFQRIARRRLAQSKEGQLK